MDNIWMNCYRCTREDAGALRSAVGICQHCGAGICARHLVEVTRPPVGGMVSLSRQRLLICAVCAHEQAPYRPLRPERDPQASSPRWIRWFRRGNRNALPTPEAALAEVERWLKSARPPQKG